MKVETIPEQRPDVVITLSWREAEILMTVVGATGGTGEGRVFIDEIYDKFAARNLIRDESLNYRGGEFRGG